MKECFRGKFFIDHEVKVLNYDYDYFILESYSLCSFHHSEAISVGTDDLPGLCSSVYSFAFNKTVQLLWQQEVYRVYLKKVVGSLCA